MNLLLCHRNISISGTHIHKIILIFQVKAGVFMNLICILVLTLAVNTWGRAYFNFDHFPSWAGNMTSSWKVGNQDPCQVSVQKASQ